MSTFQNGEDVKKVLEIQGTCAGKHETINCQVGLSGTKAALKCVNCGENHPTNYTGCEVSMKMQDIQNEAVKSRNQRQKEQQTKTHT